MDWQENSSFASWSISLYVWT